MAKVLLVGYFGYANTGDEALLEVLSGRLASWGYTVGALTAVPRHQSAIMASPLFGTNAGPSCFALAAGQMR